jgi:hypothetical protein
MKFLKQTTDGEVKTETAISTKDIKIGDDIHICRHEEGLPCEIKNVKSLSTIQTSAD